MQSVNIQLGARVRRRNDIGLDVPGAVVRLKDDDAMVYWPTDNFYQVLPMVELEPYSSIPVAA
jgi:hypothetical protein